MKKSVVSILEQVNNVVLLINPKSEVLYVSPSVKKLLGYDSKELLGEGWWKETLVKDESEVLQFNVIDSISNTRLNGGVQTERKVRTSYGAEKWFLWNTTLSDDGNVVSIGTDITLKKRAELSLEVKNNAIQEKNDEIRDSLNYAKRLQEVILPSEDAYKKCLHDAFVLYKPKDIVSGDFHWYYETEDVITMAAIDCTGHGVPGALLSVMGNSLLRTIVAREKNYDPSIILTRLDKEFLQSMSKNGALVARDGMDLGFVTIYKKEMKLQFSGAFRPMLFIREGFLKEFSGSRYPIGFYEDDRKVFDSTTIQLQKGDRFYLFSDGYADQFGGPRQKKLKKSQLKEILLHSHNLPMDEQKDVLLYHFNNWKQQSPQTDDVLMLGVEV